MKISAIVDLQFGSTGKGLFAAYLCKKHPDIDVAVSANMPNAGHTVVDEEGRKWINKVLPSGVLSPDLKYIAIGPGAVFDPAQLVKEILDLKARGITAKIIIHPFAGLLLEGHRKEEEANLSHIASTMQGSMEAQFHKMRRPGMISSNVACFNHALLSKFLIDYNGYGDLSALVGGVAEWAQIMEDAAHILVEGSQGYSLGINAGFYPYCTSRDCTVWRLLADCALPIGMSEGMRVYGTARVHPIRVGNTADGNSGPCYPDQHETTWEKLGVEPETTTVTGRIRRVFTFSMTQIVEAIKANRVDEIFLNFCNYDMAEAVRIAGSIDGAAAELIAPRLPYFAQESRYQMVRYMGFGPKVSEVLELRHD